MIGIRRAQKAVGVLAAIGALGISAIALGAGSEVTTIRAGNLVIRAEGVIRPKALPKHEFAPLTLHGHGSVATVDGSHVPPANSVQLLVDKHFKIDTAGLPSCTVRKLEADTPHQALRSCGDALLGKGSATAEVEFPESSAFSATGQLLAFNGPLRGGNTEQLDYIYVDVPVPTAVVVVVKFSKERGRFGYKAAISVPKIAGGSGSLTAFDFTLNRKWTYKGRQHSYLSGECPNGSFVDRIEALFGDGTDLTGALVSSCQPKG